MRTRPRSKSVITHLSDNDAFFKKNPSGMLREKMKDAIMVYLEEIDLQGKLPLDD